MNRPSAILLLLTLLLCGTLSAQQRHDRIHGSEIVAGQRPMPYPFLRESDVVWSTTLWKNIDLEENFNQYMYFPLDQEDRSGKKSLAYVIWEAMESEEIPIYEDDELKVPIDIQLFLKNYAGNDTIYLEIGYDEDDNELYQTEIIAKHFDGAEIMEYAICEAWFIGKEDTRLDSRRLALAPMHDVYYTSKVTREDIYMGHAALFWVPMQNMSVRRVLARNIAYFQDNNIVGQPSWDNIFINQVYHAYVTRESNLFNRSVSKYVTGQDAIYEADRIETKVFEIGDDMWEY